MTRITHNNTPWFDTDSTGREHLAARRDRSDLKRPILHRFSTSTPVQHHQLSGHLLAFGFDIIDNPAEWTADGGDVTLIVRQHADTTPDSMASTRRTLDAAVAKFGGRYEGWSTYIVLAPRRQLRRDKLLSVRARIPAPRGRSASTP